MHVIKITSLCASNETINSINEIGEIRPREILRRDDGMLLNDSRARTRRSSTGHFSPLD